MFESNLDFVFINTRDEPPLISSYKSVKNSVIGKTAKQKYVMRSKDYKYAKTPEALNGLC